MRLLQLWTCVLIYIVLRGPMGLLRSYGRPNLQQKTWNSSILPTKSLEPEEKIPGLIPKSQAAFQRDTIESGELSVILNPGSIPASPAWNIHSSNPHPIHPHLSQSQKFPAYLGR